MHNSTIIDQMENLLVSRKNIDFPLILVSVAKVLALLWVYFLIVFNIFMILPYIYLLKLRNLRYVRRELFLSFGLFPISNSLWKCKLDGILILANLVVYGFIMQWANISYSTLKFLKQHHNLFDFHATHKYMYSLASAFFFTIQPCMHHRYFDTLTEDYSLHKNHAWTILQNLWFVVSQLSTLSSFLGICWWPSGFHFLFCFFYSFTSPGFILISWCLE